MILVRPFFLPRTETRSISGHLLPAGIIPTISIRCHNRKIVTSTYLALALPFGSPYIGPIAVKERL
jgi:hypothetical protein